MQLPWRNPLLVCGFPPPLPQFFIAEFARFGEKARLSSSRLNIGFGGCVRITGAVSGRRIWFAGKAEAQIVVAITWRVVVAIGRPQVPAVVVPAAAAVHAVRPACKPFPFFVSKI